MSETSNTQIPSNKNSGRKIFLFLAIIFVLPFTVAATLHLLNVHPSGKSYGNLVSPPHVLQFSVLHDAQGKTLMPQQWLKKWSMVTVGSTGCEESCQKQLHLLKQVQTSLDKDAHRLQRVLLVPTELKTETVNHLQKQYPDLIILAGADTETIKFAGQFNAVAGSVYLIDPLGNLMMSYPESMNPKGLYSDLKRLLKNSWAG